MSDAVTYTLEELENLLITQHIMSLEAPRFELLHLREHYTSILEKPEYAGIASELKSKISDIDAQLKNIDEAAHELSPAVVASIKSAAAEKYERQKKRLRNDGVAAMVVTVDEMDFDADEASQTRIARAVTSLSKATDTIDWKLSDNRVASVTKTQLQKVLQLAVKQQTEIWTK
jgi:hypothetical protein